MTNPCLLPCFVLPYLAFFAQIFANVEPMADVRDVLLPPCSKGGLTNDSGLILVAGEQERVMTYFIPALAPSPRWCSYLDGLTEELAGQNNNTYVLLRSCALFIQDGLREDSGRDNSPSYVLHMPYMYPSYVLHTPLVYPSYALHTPFICPTCTLHMSFICPTCTLHMPFIRPSYESIPLAFLLVCHVLF